MDFAEPALLLADQAFRKGDERTDAVPTRFYLNLTERCQLQCRHCITHAPELTMARSARSMEPAVFKALAPHLRHATYLGLTHAGEPALAPLFPSVLNALRTAREGKPTVVHLLSNGVGLTVERFAELCGLGVGSLSISLDGMSAGTHDALRSGSKVAELLARIEAVSASREDRRAVRLGVAWTLTRSNVGELDALVQFAARARLDWVKVEELYPANAFAASEQVQGEVAREAVARAAEVAQQLGLLLLDHTQRVRVWKCRLAEEPLMQRFSLADDFVNRVELSPCRLPYEVVCVEPNGDVRPQSFHHPVAGNLCATDLLVLWNEEPFLAARRKLRLERPCGVGPTSCGRDPGPVHW